MPQPLYSQGRASGNQWLEGWGGGGQSHSGRGGEEKNFQPLPNSNPPTSSPQPSAVPLSYPGSCLKMVPKWKVSVQAEYRTPISRPVASPFTDLVRLSKIGCYRLIQLDNPLEKRNEPLTNILLHIHKTTQHKIYRYVRTVCLQPSSYK
jgi:hypothetical protein